MIDVLDTSPLTALLTMGEEDLQPRLLSEVGIPEAVQKELVAAPGVICEWFKIPVSVGQSLSTCPCHDVGMEIKKSIRAGGSKIMVWSDTSDLGVVVFVAPLGAWS